MVRRFLPFGAIRSEHRRRSNGNTDDEIKKMEEMSKAKEKEVLELK